MKINIDQLVLGFDGTTPVEDVPGTPLTVRKVIENGINLQDERNLLTAEQKIKAFRIGVRLNTKKRPEYNFTVDEAAFIKERVGIYYSPVVYGRLLELLGDEKVQLPEDEPEPQATPAA